MKCILAQIFKTVKKNMEATSYDIFAALVNLLAKTNDPASTFSNQIGSFRLSCFVHNRTEGLDLNICLGSQT
jgi:hypothetical protein